MKQFTPVLNECGTNRTLHKHQREYKEALQMLATFTENPYPIGGNIMQLYEKQANGRYKPHTPAPIVMPEIEEKQMVTLLTALTISMLASVYEQLPAHATMPRKIRKVEEAIKDLAKLNCEPLDPALVDVGVMAWNGAIHAMQAGLSGGVA